MLGSIVIWYSVTIVIFCKEYPKIMNLYLLGEADGISSHQHSPSTEFNIVFLKIPKIPLGSIGTLKVL